MLPGRDSDSKVLDVTMLNEGCLLSKTRDFLVRPERRPGCSLRSYALDGPNGVDGSV